MAESPVPAIVSCAGSPAAVTIAQTLGPLGVPIHALSNMEHSAVWYSRYCTKKHLVPAGPGGTLYRESAEEPEELLHAMLESVERGVLFPGTDANVRFLAKHKDTLEDAGFQMLIPDETTLNKAANKSDLAEFCEEHGFPIPKTVIVKGTEDLEAVRQLQFPIILKGVFMKNHRFVESIDELDEIYASFLEKFAGKTDKIDAVAQEWIPGPSERFAKLYVICDRDSRVIAFHTLRRLRVHTRKDGSQGDTLVAKTELIQPLIDRWLPFFQKLGWVGVASMECKYDQRDGEYKLIEINPRPWAILKVSVECGMNVPLLYYQLAQGIEVEPQSTFTPDRYYIRLLWGHLDPPEPVRCAGMLLTGHITLREVMRLYGELLSHARQVSVDVGRLRDPLPTLACMFHWGIRRPSWWFR